AEQSPQSYQRMRHHHWTNVASHCARSFLISSAESDQHPLRCCSRRPRLIACLDLDLNQVVFLYSIYPNKRAAIIFRHRRCVRPVQELILEPKSVTATHTVLFM